MSGNGDATQAATNARHVGPAFSKARDETAVINIGDPEGPPRLVRSNFLSHLVATVSLTGGARLSIFLRLKDSPGTLVRRKPEEEARLMDMR